MGTDAIEVPIFYGEDPEEVEPWVSWINDFAYDQGFSDFETRQFAYGFVEGEAHDWYCEELSRSVFRSWADLKLRIFQRFGKSREDTMTTVISFQDRMKELHSFLDRWIEEDEVEKQHEEETLADGLYLDPIRTHVGGFQKSIDPSLELILPLAISEEKNDMPTWIHQKVLQRMDDSLSQSCGIPLFGGENAGNKNLSVESYFERGKNTIEELFGSNNTTRKERHKQGKDKWTEAEINKGAGQVFDQMLRRNKKVLKKKKRWKVIAKKILGAYKKSVRSRKTEGVMVKNTARWLHYNLMKYIAEKMTSVEMSMNHHRVLDRWNLLTFSKIKERAKGEHVRKCSRPKHQTVSARRQSRGVTGYMSLVFSRKVCSELLQKKRKRAELRFKYGAHRKLSSFVTLEWINFLMEWKEQRSILKFRSKKSSWKHADLLVNHFVKLKHIEKHPWDWCKEKHQRYQRAYGINALIYLTMVIGLMKVEKKQYLASRKRAKFRKRYMRRGMKHEYMSAKLRGGYKSVLKKLAKWMYNKFKQKHINQREKIKLDSLVLLLADKMRKRTKWKCQRLAYGTIPALVKTVWVKFRIKWKNWKAKHRTKIKRKFSKYQFVLLQNFSLKLKYPGKLFTERSDEKQEIQSVFYKWRQLKEIVILNMKRLATDLNDDIDSESLKRPVKDQGVRKKQNGKWGSLSWSKYKPWKWKHLNFPSHKKRDFKRHSMRRMKECKRVKGCCIVIDELLLWKIQVKKKKLRIDNNAECRSHSLDSGTAARQVEDRFPKTNDITKKVKIFNKQGSLLVYTFVIQTTKCASHLRASEHSEKLGGDGSRLKTQKNIGKLFCGIRMMVDKWRYVAARQTFQGHKQSTLASGGLRQLSSVLAYLMVHYTLHVSQPQQTVREPAVTVSILTQLMEEERLEAGPHVVLGYRQNPMSGVTEVVIKWKGLTEEWKNVNESWFLLFNLEDKVIFKGGGIDTCELRSPSRTHKANGLQFVGWVNCVF